MKFYWFRAGSVNSLTEEEIDKYDQSRQVATYTVFTSTLNSYHFNTEIYFNISKEI